MAKNGSVPIPAQTQTMTALNQHQSLRTPTPTSPMLMKANEIDSYNQSRTRKPFNFNDNDFESTMMSAQNVNMQKNLILQQQHQMQENSFDDLDAVEVINLNQHNLIRSRHSYADNQANTNGARVRSSSASRTQANTLNNTNVPYFYSDLPKEPQAPVSILKRADSNEKMYPISRPSYNNNLNASSKRQ
jgi:hypothetical protein